MIDDGVGNNDGRMDLLQRGSAAFEKEWVYVAVQGCSTIPCLIIRF